MDVSHFVVKTATATASLYADKEMPALCENALMKDIVALHGDERLTAVYKVSFSRACTIYGMPVPKFFEGAFRNG